MWMSRASHKDSENVFHVSIFRRIHTFLSILDISSSACRYFLAVAKLLLLIFNEVYQDDVLYRTNMEG